ncbi:MAG TPA: Nramp family divalent metal transporter [Rhizomicrobium sp.]|nr:Nramp family divalent metal transporter [Rhizomicrobium sp.]
MTFPFRLPTTATAPFCPSEVRGSIAVPRGLPFWQKLLRFAGPGLLISVGYMDPGNWATDLEAGSRYGYALLSVVLLSSLVGIVVQTLSARLGIAAERDLAALCRERYPRVPALALWVLAEVAIIACDVAEVLGSALALQLLFGLPLWAGVLLTGFDTVIVLGLKGRGFRQLEAIVLGLILTIAAGFAIELALTPPLPGGVLAGLIPSRTLWEEHRALYLAIGILGATVMPHNLYLHSSVVQTRLVTRDHAAKHEAIALATADIALSLLLAMLVNMAILVLAAAAFHARGLLAADIGDAYRLLQPVAGPFAATIFGLALLAAGQSSTFTGTVAGQVIMEGFLRLKIPCYQRRLITRALALAPALAGVLWTGEHAVGRLLVLSQVVLSLQLPFALYPLVRFTGSPAVMGRFASPRLLKGLAWAVFGAVTAANIALLADLAA